MLWLFERAGSKNGNNNDWQLWQQHNHPIELSSNKIIDQKIESVHFNPVADGYVEGLEHWLYSGDRNYSSLPEFIVVKLGFKLNVAQADACASWGMGFIVLDLSSY